MLTFLNFPLGKDALRPAPCGRWPPVCATTRPSARTVLLLLLYAYKAKKVINTIRFPQIFTLLHQKICRWLKLLSADYLALDDFLCPTHNTVHGFDPFPLRPPLQILGYALGNSHLLDDKLATILRLLIEVGRVGVQFARQNQVIKQKRVYFFQICPLHQSSFFNGQFIALQ